MQRQEFICDTPFRLIHFLDDEKAPDPTVQEAVGNITEEDFHLCIKAVPYAATVCTARYGDSRLAVEFHKAEPPLDLAAWDHVTECSLDLPSGCLHMSWGWGNPEDWGTMHVVPGCYRMRVCHGNLASVADDQYSREGDDHYLVVFWPAPHRKLTVLKQHTWIA